jgi:serine protease Do
MVAMRQSLRTAVSRAVLLWGLLVLTAASAMAAGARGFLSGQADEPAAELRGDAGGLQAASRHLAQIAATTTPSVVHILAEYDGRSGAIEETGSGVLMSSPRTSGVFVVTNRHVIVAARLNSIQIHLQDGRVVSPRKKLDDLATDIAVLILDVPDLKPARWGDSDNLDIGHVVLAMGSPFGLSQSVTMGIISAKGRRSLELGKQRDVINRGDQSRQQRRSIDRFAGACRRHQHRDRLTGRWKRRDRVQHSD